MKMRSISNSIATSGWKNFVHAKFYLLSNCLDLQRQTLGRSRLLELDGCHSLLFKQSFFTYQIEDLRLCTKVLLSKNGWLWGSIKVLETQNYLSMKILALSISLQKLHTLSYAPPSWTNRWLRMSQVPHLHPFLATKSTIIPKFYFFHFLVIISSIHYFSHFYPNFRLNLVKIQLNSPLYPFRFPSYEFLL